MTTYVPNTYVPSADEEVLPRPRPRDSWKRTRRSPNRSFIAVYGGDVCARCLLEIHIGERAHYTPDGELVHHWHPAAPETPAVPCASCWLVGPCDCDD